jgi:hypothetical protein
MIRKKMGHFQISTAGIHKCSLDNCHVPRAIADFRISTLIKLYFILFLKLILLSINSFYQRVSLGYLQHAYNVL